MTPAPGQPAHRRRRLLRRSETVEDYKLRLGERGNKTKRNLSLTQRVSRSKLYSSVSTIDRDELEESVNESSDKVSDIRNVSTRLRKVTAKRKRRRRSAAEGSESDLARTGSESTLRARAVSPPTSEFSSCVSLSGAGELEYDLYDCHIDNAMAAPGSLFAPAPWDMTPGLELEMEELFPVTGPRDERDERDSPVTRRHATSRDTCLVSR